MVDTRSRKEHRGQQFSDDSLYQSIIFDLQDYLMSLIELLVSLIELPVALVLDIVEQLLFNVSSYPSEMSKRPLSTASMPPCYQGWRYSLTVLRWCAGFLRGCKHNRSAPVVCFQLADGSFSSPGICFFPRRRGVRSFTQNTDVPGNIFFANILQNQSFRDLISSSVYYVLVKKTGLVSEAFLFCPASS